MSNDVTGQRPAQLWIHSVSSGESSLLFESVDRHFEAPNWTPDGQWLIINSDGLLYRIPVGGGDLELIDTGELAGINNDHLLSPDGSTIYVSAGGHLYSVPITGGSPTKISNDHDHPFTYYLHGISPDGTTLAYVAVEPYQGDPGGYRNIFTIGSAGGEDIQLTDSPAFADGPEFTPDGAWIYFNSEHGATTPGHAQIFRMRTDGGELTQLTDDERVNWFPHISPDGSAIVFISFPPGTEGHPADREVMVKSMTPDGDDVTELVALFGGQGTINVNSWAPDSDRFAYVAYPPNH